MTIQKKIASASWLLIFVSQNEEAHCFQSPSFGSRPVVDIGLKNFRPSSLLLQMAEDSSILSPMSDDASTKDDTTNKAAAETGTINDRLIEELKQEVDKEKFGSRSSAGKKLGLSSRRDTRTDEEREAALAAARNLNGVNPAVAIGGAVFALAFAGGLWYATQSLAGFFAMHPVETDVYFVQRVTQVFRNVVMGLVSLASGFFGVTGLGILLLGIRVAYGVAKGELDPTPIKKKAGEEIEIPNVWDLMMNKKPNRRSRQ